ncbi:MAG: MGMT family protein [Candidatus Omnitrophica bacterium]|nr:MGMT family protein [Candidatus Omnitrophota bacterium]
MNTFTKKVYKATLSIPLGQVRSYKWIAKKAGKPKALRAVGQILKNNPYPLIIPCHRVIKSNGEPGNYSAGGPKVKKLLIELERQIAKLVLY